MEIKVKCPDCGKMPRVTVETDYCQLHPGTFSTIPAVKEVKIDV